MLYKLPALIKTLR